MGVAEKRGISAELQHLMIKADDTEEAFDSWFFKNREDNVRYIFFDDFMRVKRMGTDIVITSDCENLIESVEKEDASLVETVVKLSEAKKKSWKDLEGITERYVVLVNLSDFFKEASKEESHSVFKRIQSLALCGRACGVRLILIDKEFPKPMRKYKELFRSEV